MSIEYQEFDKNVIVNATIRNVETDLLDVRQGPFDIYGLYEPRDPDKVRFERIPHEVALSVSEGVAVQSYEPAGGIVRFSTDSDFVAIQTETDWISYRPHFTLIEAGGFDLYVDIDGRDRLKGVFIPPYGAKEGYEQILRFPDRKKRELTIYFPLHSCVKKLLIGVCPGAYLGHGKKYINEKPVVFYGSSITQGTGTSRPGLMYTNMLSRRLNIHTYNLGFSGQCKGEPAMAEYIAGLSMSAFVLDYDENAPTAEYLQETHEPFFRRIRQAHPDLPIIMLSRPSIYPDNEKHRHCRDVVYQTYTNALAAGDRNVYFLDGSEYLKEYGYDDCILDGIHPNDLGHSLMADNIQKYLERIITDSDDFKKG